jgi:hypothetical protein
LEMKALMAIGLLVFLVLASQTFVPLKPYQTYPVSGEAYWMDFAERAWQYFQPDKGVNAQTGLHGATLTYPYFTEWDLGTYIQAIIDAKELGLLQMDGQWGFDHRISSILDFLETRKLADTGLPYLWYDSRTGEPYGDEITFGIDEGKLYLALYNLKTLEPDLAGEIDYIVKVRNNNTALLPDPESWLEMTDFYGYYVASAFKAFEFEGWDNVRSSILNTIVSQAKVTAYGVELPTAHISNEPLLLTFFEINPQDPKFTWLLTQVNLAQEARYRATGYYTAFSEGNTGLSDPTYAYEFVVDYDGSTFKVEPATTPIAYLKVAVGFDAIFHSEYTSDMVEYIRGQLPASSDGFQDGVAEDGRVVDTIVDRTNGLIISAAKYAIKTQNSDLFQWRNEDLESFPDSFIQNGSLDNIAMIVGDNTTDGSVAAADSLGAIGGILIAERLGLESSSAGLNAELDSWVTQCDSRLGNVAMLDNTTNLIIVGSPEVNAVGYYFNSLTGWLDKPLVPVQYLVNSSGGYSFLYVPSSGSIYQTECDEKGKLVADYGVIMAFQDYLNRHVVMVYGLAAEGTLGACQVLSEYAQWNLAGNAVVLKFSVETSGIFPSNGSVVEVVG